MNNNLREKIAVPQPFDKLTNITLLRVDKYVLERLRNFDKYYRKHCKSAIARMSFDAHMRMAKADHELGKLSLKKVGGINVKCNLNCNYSNPSVNNLLCNKGRGIHPRKRLA